MNRERNGVNREYFRNKKEKQFDQFCSSIALFTRAILGRGTIARGAFVALVCRLGSKS